MPKIFYIILVVMINLAGQAWADESRSFPRGTCNDHLPTTGTLYEVYSQAGDDVYKFPICCPDPQIPTGIASPQDGPTCKPAGNDRGSCVCDPAKPANNPTSIVFCRGDLSRKIAPYKSCCPDNTYATCDATEGSAVCINTPNAFQPPKGYE